MNELKFLLILIAVSLFACQNENVLTKVDEKQKLEIFRYSQYPPKDSVVFKNHLGEVMNKDTLNDYEKKGYFFDFYKNENGKIVEVVYHQKSKEDEIFLEKLANYDDGLRKVPVLEINCDEGKELLERLMEADQKNREGSIDSNIDIVIQDSLFNYINQCGLPSIEKVGKRGIFAMFLIIQHSELEFMENYLPILKEYRDRGELSAEAVALMEDRVLILNGLPQLYGSQINNDSNGNPTLLEYEGTLCDVNNRRDKIGMIPVEDYVARFGIELEVNCN